MAGVVVLVLTATAVVFGALYGWAWRRGLLTESTRVPGKRRTVVVAEPLAYLGATLILAGACVELGQRWGGISGWGHVAILGSAAVFFLAVGFVSRWSADTSMQRLIGVAWFVSAGCVGAAAGVAASEVFASSGAVTTLAVGVAVAVYSVPLWLLDRREMQLAVLFTGVIAAVCGAILTLADEAAPWLAFSVGLWVLGVCWAVLGWAYREPLWTSVPVGAAVALAAPSLAVWHHGWLFPVGIATSAAVMAASVPLRNAVLLTFGTLGLTGYVAAAAVRYLHFHQSLGIAQALVSSGVLVIGLAVLTARLRRAKQSPSERPPQARSPRARSPQARPPRARPPQARSPQARPPRTRPVNRMHRPAV